MKKKKKKVLILIGSKISQNQIAIYSSLQKQLKNYDCILIIKKQYKYIFKYSDKIYSYKSIPNILNIAVVYDFFIYLYYVKKLKPHLLYHFCTPKRMGLIVALAGKILKIPSIVTMSGEVLKNYVYYKKIFKRFSSLIGTYFSLFAFKLCTHIICLGPKLKKQLINYGFSESKISVIPQPIDLERFKPVNDKSVFRDVLKIPKNKFIILFVGRLTVLKGIDKIYEIIINLSSLNDYYFLIIGEGRFARKFDSFSSETVKLCRNVPHTMIDKYYKAADVTLLPSKTEGLSTVVLESLACGVPIIAANVGDVSTYVSNICSSVSEYIKYIINKDYNVNYLPEIFNDNNLANQYSKLFDSLSER